MLVSVKGQDTASLERILSEVWVSIASEERSDKCLIKESPTRCPDQLNAPERIHFQTMVSTCVGKIIPPGESPPVIISTPAFRAHHLPILNNRDLRMAFTRVRGHINDAGARTGNSHIYITLGMRGPYNSSLLERKFHNAQGCFILITHLALFLPFLQISKMLILCLGWFPIFPDIYFSLIDFH